MPRVTVDMARRMTFSELDSHVYGMLVEFEAPTGDDVTARQREDWINRTLERCPDVYAWILSLHAYFDHWTDVSADQFGQKDMGYKVYRQKRDLCKNAASAAKMRYEGASRRVTQLQRHEDGAEMKGHR